LKKKEKNKSFFLLLIEYCKRYNKKIKCGWARGGLRYLVPSRKGCFIILSLVVVSFFHFCFGDLFRSSLDEWCFIFGVLVLVLFGLYVFDE